MLKHLFLTTLAIAVSLPVLADVTRETVSDVRIEDASIIAVQDIGYRLMFKIANDSPEPITITGLTSPAANSVDLIYFSHHGGAADLHDLTLLPDEETDFSTSHLQARLIGFDDNQTIVPFTIVLRKGSVEGEAHVH